MTVKQITSLLQEQGIFHGRSLGAEEHIYRENQTRLFVEANAQILTPRHCIIKRTDIHLGLDAAKLTAAARAADENLYVLPKGDPLLRQGRSNQEMLRDALWWTRIHADGDKDTFTSLDSGSSRRPNRVRLTCVAGKWKNHPAYSLGFLGNPKWCGLNMGAAAVVLLGRPPEHLRKVDMKVKLVGEPSLTRGRPVRAVTYQRSGPLEYIWFSNRTAVPAVLYDNSVALLQNVSFTVHRDSAAIHVHQGTRLIGFITTARIYAPEVVANAQRELDVLLPMRRKHASDFARGDEKATASQIPVALSVHKQFNQI